MCKFTDCHNFYEKDKIYEMLIHILFRHSTKQKAMYGMFDEQIKRDILYGINHVYKGVPAAVKRNVPNKIYNNRRYLVNWNPTLKLHASKHPKMIELQQELNDHSIRFFINAPLDPRVIQTE